MVHETAGVARSLVAIEDKDHVERNAVATRSIDIALSPVARRIFLFFYEYSHDEYSVGVLPRRVLQVLFYNLKLILVVLVPSTGTSV